MDHQMAIKLKNNIIVFISSIEFVLIKDEGV